MKVEIVSDRRLTDIVYRLAQKMMTNKIKKKWGETVTQEEYMALLFRVGMPYAYVKLLLRLRKRDLELVVIGDNGKVVRLPDQDYTLFPWQKVGQGPSGSA